MLEAAHSFCSWHFFYHYVIDDWGKTLALVTEPIVWLVVLCSWDSYKTKALPNIRVLRTLAVQVVIGAIVGTVVRG